MVPRFCRLKLPEPRYCSINIPQFFMKCIFAFYNGFMLKILACAIMPGFCKSGHIYPYKNLNLKKKEVGITLKSKESS